MTETQTQSQAANSRYLGLIEMRRQNLETLIQQLHREISLAREYPEVLIRLTNRRVAAERELGQLSRQTYERRTESSVPTQGKVS